MIPYPSNQYRLIGKTFSSPLCLSSLWGSQISIDALLRRVQLEANIQLENDLSPFRQEF